MRGKSPLPEEDGPTFDPETHWCLRHLEPFRETWGENAAWALATTGLFQEMLHRTEFIDACGGDTRLLARALREYSPMCCYLGDEVTKRWVDLALGPAEAWKEAHDALAKSDRCQ